MDMKNVGGIWLPASEEHLVEWMTTVNKRVNGKLTYQYHKLEQCMMRLDSKHRRVAVDVGAHVGLWTMHLAPLFGHVHAFEPNHDLRGCFELNVPHQNVTRYEMALGPQPGKVSLRNFAGNSGHTMNTGVTPDGTIPMATLDSMALPVCDFIKIDVEGFEPGVIEGATETILRCHPVIMVECKGFENHHGYTVGQAWVMLKALGMVQVLDLGGDKLMVWKK